MADCLLVLGSNFLTKTSIREMELRVDKAVELYKQKTASKMIVSGGYTHGSKVSEASYMMKRAVAQGVSRKDLVLEEEAKTTIGNFVYVKKILEKKKWKSVVVVTSPHHVPRARNIANKVLPSFKVSFASSKNLPIHQAIPKYVREAIVYLRYRTVPVNTKKA